jgi:uncharacterized membrane protein SpoIIM required for sporulation
MDVERFTEQRRADWEELGDLADRAKGKPERLGPPDALRMGALYRATAADLAIARRRFRSEAVVGQLETLVRRSRSLVYRSPVRDSTVVRFFTRDYWVRVRQRPGLLAIAAALLFVPAVCALLWGWLDPDRARGFLPGIFEAVGERSSGTDLGLSLGEQSAMSSAIFTNNIRVTLLAFALGITCGLGTAFVLLQNGVLLGVVFGLATSTGKGWVVVEFVAAHGILELSCIVVGAAAGLRVGAAIIDPGRRRRSQVLVEEGRAAVEMILGTLPWLVVAGLVEGFITPAGFGLAPALAVGFALGAVYWGLAVWRGAPRRDVS